jgi:hypothetical protein
MSEPVAFKSGRDLASEEADETDEVVVCAVCGKKPADETVCAEGEQVVPPLCPDCLRWALTGDGECCFGIPS